MICARGDQRKLPVDNEVRSEIIHKKSTRN